MTDAFHPVHLTTSKTVDTVAIAETQATAAILTGPGLSRIIAERLAQVTTHGYTPDNDLRHDDAELAMASISHIGTYADLERNPDKVWQEGDFPDQWPFDNRSWRQPRYAERAHALVKGIALAWAELDRLIAADAIDAQFRAAARPLMEPAPRADSWRYETWCNEAWRTCGRCNHQDMFSLAEVGRAVDARTLPPCSNCNPKGGIHE